MIWRRISKAPKLLSRIFTVVNVQKMLKIFDLFFFLKNFPFKIKIKKQQYVRRQWLMNTYKISNRYRHQWLRYDFPNWFSELGFLTEFDASKSVLEPFFASFAKIWPRNMYRSSKSRVFLPFLPGDLRWRWPVLWSHSTGNDTYKCQGHYPCRFIGFVCAWHRNCARRWCHQARKVEILTLTWPVTSSVTSRSPDSRVSLSEALDRLSGVL